MRNGLPVATAAPRAALAAYVTADTVRALASACSPAGAAGMS